MDRCVAARGAFFYVLFRNKQNLPKLKLKLHCDVFSNKKEFPKRKAGIIKILTSGKTPCNLSKIIFIYLGFSKSRIHQYGQLWRQEIFLFPVLFFYYWPARCALIPT
jgi:hypothetical protein